MSIWANDSFVGDDGVLGGNLTDADTPFAARDKVAHLVAGILLGAALARWSGMGELAALGCALAIAAGWELVELLRYLAWKRSGLGPWPFAADLLSWRDVVVTVAGAAAGIWLL